MTRLNRREFLKITGLGGILLAHSSCGETQEMPLLSFSTLSCPDWPIETIVDYAVECGYSGIELRGIQEQLNLPEAALFKTDAKVDSFNELIKKNHLKIVALGASAFMHHPLGKERERSINEAKNYIRLAEQINCPYVRVFPNNFPADQKKEDTLELMASALQVLGDFARENGQVSVLLETHGDLLWSKDIEKVMQMTDHSRVGLIWDITNMWSVTKEPINEVYDRLNNHIHHAHIKDYDVVDGKKHYVKLGEGIAPVFEAIDLLHDHNYQGYYSFEWEKRWHPELDEPERVIPDYAEVMRGYFKNQLP